MTYLNLGRKFGAPVIARAKHVKLQSPYDSKKKEVMRGATASKVPMNKADCKGQQKGSVLFETEQLPEA